MIRVRRRHLVVACAAAIFGAALTPGAQAAEAPGGAGDTASKIELTMLGSMTWGFYDTSVIAKNPTETAQVKSAMDQAINDYNTVAAYSIHVPVTYNAGVPTAEAGYMSSMSFGGRRSAATAHHELSHFLGMQSWVGGDKATWGSLCSAGWKDTAALKRMRLFDGPNVGIGCSLDTGHFWNYGLNYDNEWNWLSKGRNVSMVSAMRSDMGLSDGSTPATTDYRLVNRSTGQVAADSFKNTAGSVISARSTVSSLQTWSFTFADGFVRLKNRASQRLLDGSTSPVASASDSGSSSQTWEMTPTDNGYFQMRNQQTGKCLSAPASDAALTIVDCSTGDPAAHLQWHLAKAPAPTPATTEITGVGSKRCLDVRGNGGAGTPMIIWDCWGGSNQKFTYTAAQELRTPSGLCLDAWRAGRDNGTKVVAWYCHGGVNQKWKLNADGSIVEIDSGRCLDVRGMGTANGSEVWLWDCWGGSNQKWNIVAR